MHRVLFHIRSFPVLSYTVTVIFAYLIGYFFVLKEVKSKKYKPSTIIFLSICIIVFPILGARSWYILEHWNYFSQNLTETFKFWKGGLVFYGGFIGGIIGVIFFSSIAKTYLLETLDALSPGIAILIGIGRIGCFLNGCCYGKITVSPIGICFPAKHYPPVYWDQLKNGLIPPNAPCSLPVIPTQIISSIDLFLVFAILWSLRKKEIFKGFLFALFMGLYGIHRFIIDFFRYYSERIILLEHFTLYQFLSLSMILISIIFISIGLRKKKMV